MFSGSVKPHLNRVQAERRAALRVVLMQGAITLAVAAVCAIGWGANAAKSAAWGGGIGMTGAALMALARVGPAM